MKKRSLRSSFGHVFSSAVPWSVVFWCCIASAALGGQKAEVRSCLQSAADMAAQAGVSSLDCSTGGWAGALQAVLDQLATQEVPNEPGMSTSLAVNPGLVQVLDDADTPANTWDKVLVWDYAASGRTGADADKNLIVRIRRGRYYPEAGEGRKVFESMEHDEATNTGWVTANPNIPAFVAANAVLVELERPRVRVNSEKSPARAVYQSVKATALAVAGPVDEVMVAPFAIPVCSLLDEYGEFQGPRMAGIDRIFTEAARYCAGEGPNCNNYPMWPYTPCSCAYEARGDKYLWSEEDPASLFEGSMTNFYTSSPPYLGGSDANPDIPYFCYQRLGWTRDYMLDQLSLIVKDGALAWVLPREEWRPAADYLLGLYGKTELMASDHAAVVGLPQRVGGLAPSEDLILAILDQPDGLVPARLGERFSILPQGLTHNGAADTEDRVWRQITGQNGSPETHPPMDQTDLGTIEKNHVEVTMSSYYFNLGLHYWVNTDSDYPDGSYCWDYGLCSARRVKLQCSTRGDDASITPHGQRLDIAYGGKAPEAGNLTKYWHENERQAYGIDLDGDMLPDDFDGAPPADLGFENLLGISNDDVIALDVALGYDGGLVDYVNAIKSLWDEQGVMARVFVAPADGVNDDTPVWKVKVPVIAVRGASGACCQDLNGATDGNPGPLSDWDPVVDPSAIWEIIGFVDMLVYDVSMRDTSGWLPPFKQEELYGLSVYAPSYVDNTDAIGMDDGTGATYGPMPFYFFKDGDVRNLQPANAVRARVTTATDFIPTSANEGSRSPQLVRGWGRK